MLTLSSAKIARYRRWLEFHCEIEARFDSI
jgi:hypothetical protein